MIVLALDLSFESTGSISIVRKSNISIDSNIPHKRHIARDVGAALKQLREHPELPMKVSQNYVGDAVHVVTTATELVSKLVMARMATVPESAMATA
jgi:hypothetical protein